MLVQRLIQKDKALRDILLQYNSMIGFGLSLAMGLKLTHQTEQSQALVLQVTH